VRAPWLSAAGGFAVSVALAVGAGLVLPIFVEPTHTRGATRSVHLARQRRQQEAREAAERAAAAQGGIGNDARHERSQ
jgi:heme exporter protein D